ncbi:thioredoxin domain-containing protein [Sphingobium boeckii]|uniref:Protein-disulfide isomerase n=1 Tax=Sphingobium boeckii TaxID=1082345 RepID=A0A7W9AI88_9SPHN|nr:thioredoxin domain-containing protein [Sphingobium boeckii]MBB5686100.1 protein-disulfide isomerase [Sphingobium boeckii]
MKLKSALPILTIAIALAACSKEDAGNNAASSNTAGVTAPAGAQWTETASKTEAGGFLLGNPDAKVKLIEYGALSCSHCAQFSAESSAPMKALIAKGTLSYEMRPFLLNILDMPAFLLARCNGPVPYFPISEQIFADQANWLGLAQQLTPADQAAWQGLKPEQVAPLIAAKLQLDTFVQQRGVAPEKAKACLSDKAAIDELSKITESGVKEFEITGTPTFVVNGTVERVGTWKDLEPMLIAAGA